MLVGGSSGTAMHAAMELCKTLPEGKRVVVILPDSIRNYMTKFLNNDWLYEAGFISEEECIKQANSKMVPSTDWGQDYTISDLHLKEAAFLDASKTVAEAIDEIQ